MVPPLSQHAWPLVTKPRHAVRLAQAEQQFSTGKYAVSPTESPMSSLSGNGVPKASQEDCADAEEKRMA